MQKKIHIYISAVIIIALLAVYWQVTGFSFINFDDNVYVTENFHVTNGITVEGIQWAFAYVYNGMFQWHPLTWLSHMLDCQLFGLDPGKHHLINLLFHIINSLLLFFLFRKMTGAVWQSAFVAMLFALHPVNVDTVAWITMRKSLVSTLFLFLSIWFYVDFARHPSTGRFMAVFLFFLLGLLAKPMLITLPCMLLLLDYWPLKRIRFSNARPESEGSSEDRAFSRIQVSAVSLVIEKIPLFILSFACAFWSSLSHGPSGLVTETAPMTLRLSNALVSYIIYIKKLFWPVELAVFYPFPTSIPTWQVLLSVLLLLCLTILFIYSIKLTRAFITGWLWFLGTLIPVSGLLQPGLWPALADRWAYIPYIGLFIILAWGVPTTLLKWRHRNMAMALLAAVFIVALSARTHFQASFWKNSTALFSRTLVVTENNQLAQLNLGLALHKEEGKIEEAIKHYIAVLKNRPDLPIAYINLGKAYKDIGRIDEAVSQYKKAIELDPSSYAAHINLGNMGFEKGRFEEAISYYKQAVQIKPNSVNGHIRLGFAYSKAEKYDKASEQFNIALKINPHSDEAYNNLGILAVKTRRLNRAVFYFKKALTINPDLSNAEKNLKNIMDSITNIKKKIQKIELELKADPDNIPLLFQAGKIYRQNSNFSKAIDIYKKILIVEPDSSEAYKNLAFAYARQGDYEQGLTSFKKAVALQPHDPQPYYYIACIYSRQNQTKKAVAWLKKAISHGYSNWSQLKTSRDLNNIKHTEYYKQLIKNY